MRSSCSGHSIELVYQRICDQLQTAGIDSSIYKLKSNSFFPLRDIISLNKLGADIFHISGDVNFIATFLFKKNTVLTIHDIGRYLELKSYKKILYKFYWIILPLFFSHYIFTSSEATKNKLITAWRFCKGKIKHVPICSGLEIKPNVIESTKTFKILHMGTNKNKNLTNVIKSLLNIDCTLWIVGKISSKDINLLKKNKIHFKNFVNITNKDIISLYQDANLVTFPSFHEGFGLPIIEAQSAGTPVITSRLSPMQDIAGNAAHLVDPHSVSEIRDGIVNLISNPDLQKKMIANGLRNAEKYSAKIVTNKHQELYQELLEKSL